MARSTKKRIMLRPSALFLLTVATTAMAFAILDNPVMSHAPSGSTPLCKLVNYGGPIIPNINIIPVYIGDSFDPNFMLQMNTFYSWLPTSRWMKVLQEYGIGFGTRGNQIMYNSSQVASYFVPGTVLTDTQVHDFVQQNVVNKLPASPTINTFFSIHFGPGFKVNNSAGTTCSEICAFHSIVWYNSTSFYSYAVIPDLSQSGCNNFACGTGSVLDQTMSISSHEIAEACTDPAITQAFTYAPPLAWYDGSKGCDEIGDVCNHQQFPIDGYTVQKIYSNNLGQCVGSSDTSAATSATTTAATSATTVTTTATSATSATSAAKITFSGVPIFASQTVNVIPLVVGIDSATLNMFYKKLSTTYWYQNIQKLAQATLSIKPPLLLSLSQLPVNPTASTLFSSALQLSSVASYIVNGAVNHIIIHVGGDLSQCPFGCFQNARFNTTITYSIIPAYPVANSVEACASCSSDQFVGTTAALALQLTQGLTDGVDGDTVVSVCGTQQGPVVFGSTSLNVHAIYSNEKQKCLIGSTKSTSGTKKPKPKKKPSGSKKSPAVYL
ncbi:hypothetical protein BC830DRAFT_1097197 [Chytriomyces sp. MP71]|nr:hypothetical protein BC830DRAFT_1097197 [Chytriomyces sp. MP71]